MIANTICFGGGGGAMCGISGMVLQKQIWEQRSNWKRESLIGTGVKCYTLFQQPRSSTPPPILTREIALRKHHILVFHGKYINEEMKRDKKTWYVWFCNESKKLFNTYEIKSMRFYSSPCLWRIWLVLRWHSFQDLMKHKYYLRSGVLMVFLYSKHPHLHVMWSCTTVCNSRNVLSRLFPVQTNIHSTWWFSDWENFSKV